LPPHSSLTIRNPKTTRFPLAPKSIPRIFQIGKQGARDQIETKSKPPRRPKFLLHLHMNRSKRKSEKESRTLDGVAPPGTGQGAPPARLGAPSRAHVVFHKSLIVFSRCNARAYFTNKGKKTPSNIVFLTKTKTIMLRVLRPTRANRRTIPQAYCLIACAFTPPLPLFTSLLKKSLILIHSASFSPITAPCGCPVLDVNAHSPRWCHAPNPSPLAHAPSCTPPAPSCHSVGVCGARATCPAD
jgi:hypothetical protein